MQREPALLEQKKKKKKKFSDSNSRPSKKKTSEKKILRFELATFGKKNFGDEKKKKKKISDSNSQPLKKKKKLRRKKDGGHFLFKSRCHGIYHAKHNHAMTCYISERRYRIPSPSSEFRIPIPESGTPN